MKGRPANRGPAKPSDPSRQLPGGQRSTAAARSRWFRAIAIFSPLLLLALAELTLRLSGWGVPTAFFLPITVGGHEKLVENQRFGWRFFPPLMARAPQPLCVPADKPRELLRIFILGESAAMGDPEPAYGLNRQLERLLQARHPEKEFEVANVAMTAISSHAIREIASDCSKASGDCWVIYPGNNEVIGPFGAGTVFGRQAASLSFVRLSLALQKTRLVQALTRLRASRHPVGEWLGMELFLRHQVTRQDPRLDRVYSNYRANLNAILSYARRAGSRVVLSTMAVNLSDSPPFASSHRTNLGTEQRAEWERYFAAGKQAENNSQHRQALAAYDRAAVIDDQHAELIFRRATCKAALGDTLGARQDFSLARDLDTLRFRADSQLNAVMRELAAERRVPFVDAEAEFAQIPGEQFFYDHVHLNFAGTYRLATLLLPQVEQALFGAHNRSQETIGETELQRKLAFTPFDQRQILVEMRARLQQPPFSAQIHSAERDARLAATLAAMTEAPEASIPRYRTALNDAPGDWVLHARFAKLLEAVGDQSAAAAHWQNVVRLMPRYPEGYFQLGNLAHGRGSIDEAEAFYRQVLQIRPESPEALNGLGLIEKNRGRVNDAERHFKAALQLSPTYEAGRINLAVLLAGTGRGAEAKEQYQALLRVNTNNVAARINLARLASDQGDLQQSIALYEEALRLDPENALAHYNLANALCTLRQNETGIAHYRAALKFKPAFVEARFNLGLELARADRIEEATRELAEVVRLQPDHVEARFNYGVALAKQKYFTGAVKEFQEVLKLQPGHPSARSMMERASALAGANGR